MFGIHIITSICHQFESFVSEAHERFDHKASNSALVYVDLLRKTIVPEGRSPQGLAEIEQGLERLRTSSLSGRISLLLVEPSAATRKVYQEIFASRSIHTVMLNSGLAALERLLHEPFDMLVVSRELPDLNATALVAALRESGGRNKDIPVVMVSSNSAPVPAYLRIDAKYLRDTQLVAHLRGQVELLLNGESIGRRAAP